MQNFATPTTTILTTIRGIWIVPIVGPTTNLDSKTGGRLRTNPQQGAPTTLSSQTSIWGTLVLAEILLGFATFTGVPACGQPRFEQQSANQAIMAEQ